jgi:L-aspartate oxidase
MSRETDRRVLIVGAGIAGLATALRLAERGVRSDVIHCGDVEDSASILAQGGIAAALAEDDSVEAHALDTITAGGGLCHADSVRRIVSGGPDAIAWLSDLGVPFTRDANGALHLTREGGHRHRRVVHAQDATGHAVMRVLIDSAKAHPSIRLLGQRAVIALETARNSGLGGPERCIGVKAVNYEAGTVESHRGHAVILATGGAAGVFEVATSRSTGDGIALAWEAGCRVANMEFMQFHPTCLVAGGGRHGPTTLISEALRGEGARLVLADGKPFMSRYDERGELAPRDVVSRAIVQEMHRHGTDHVLLDISHRPAAELRTHFPNIIEACKQHGFDLTREAIPVAPGAHYTCGGIVTDPQGHTDLPRLFAIGECTFTGLHGANRLASNSLLEALVQAVHVTRAVTALRPLHTPPALGIARLSQAADEAPTSGVLGEMRRLMWAHVGLERDAAGLRRAQSQISALRRSLRDAGGDHQQRAERALTVASLITSAALMRRESRGTHLRTDYPDTVARARDTILSPQLKRRSAGMIRR